MTTLQIADDELQVRGIIVAAGPRGASHEDFVEAALAPRYITALRNLADQGLDVRTDFTTGMPRWTLGTSA